jgi:mRNA-degrading endonuclease YafQ of YafQ-DinJ toxin-antitoxin module
MREVYKHKTFLKSYKRRIRGNKELEKIVDKALDYFESNLKSGKLKVHNLHGEMAGQKSMILKHDLRILFYESPDRYYLLDIGTHNQVYW